MIELADAGLSVSVLEPGADESRLGSRYCSGGYVWQVSDERLGPLCAGPRFPDAEPPPFDGQGLPEVFEIALGHEQAWVGDDVYVIGVGRVRRESALRPFHVRDNPTVAERVAWDIEHGPTAFEARSRAEFAAFAFELVRTLRLSGRTLVSNTLLRNRGKREIPVRWFAHPFFPWPKANGERRELCHFSAEMALLPGGPLRENARGYVEAVPEVSWEAGHYVVPRVALGGRLAIEQQHPALGSVEIRCGFALGWLALWGNARCFSCEPFFATVIPSGAEVTWGIEYRFGDAP